MGTLTPLESTEASQDESYGFKVGDYVRHVARKGVYKLIGAYPANSSGLGVYFQADRVDVGASPFHLDAVNLIRCEEHEVVAFRLLGY